MSFQLETVYKPDTKNVDMIFSDPDGFYQVPNFQRPYSWEDIYAAFEEIVMSIFRIYDICSSKVSFWI